MRYIGCSSFYVYMCITIRKNSQYKTYTCKSKRKNSQYNTYTRVKLKDRTDKCFRCVYVLYWLFFPLVLPVYLRYISCSSFMFYMCICVILAVLPFMCAWCKTERKSSQYNTDTHVKLKGRAANITHVHM
jgi:hypothetical protein